MRLELVNLVTSRRGITLDDWGGPGVTLGAPPRPHGGSDTGWRARGLDPSEKQAGGATSGIAPWFTRDHLWAPVRCQMLGSALKRNLRLGEAGQVLGWSLP